MEHLPQCPWQPFPRVSTFSPTTNSLYGSEVGLFLDLFYHFILRLLHICCNRIMTMSFTVKQFLGYVIFTNISAFRRANSTLCWATQSRILWTVRPWWWHFHSQCEATGSGTTCSYNQIWWWVSSLSIWKVMCTILPITFFTCTILWKYWYFLTRMHMTLFCFLQPIKVNYISVF
jgi:hypothetical protein